MINLLEYFTNKIANNISEKIKYEISPLAPYLRQLAIGLLLILVSFPLFVVAIIFLILGLFFNLVPYNYLVAPALWSTLAASLSGALLVLIGMRFIRKPR